MFLVSENYQSRLLIEADINVKCRQLPADIEKFWTQHNICRMPETPSRDGQVMQEPEGRKRKGLGFAIVELQAAEKLPQEYLVGK